jgi:hypothetical protein
MKFIRITKFLFFFDLLKSSYIIFGFNALIFIACIAIEVYELVLYTEFKKEVEDGPFSNDVTRRRFTKPTEHGGMTGEKS